MFDHNKNELRQVFFDAWQKHLQNLPLMPIHAEIIQLILLHPEYQSVFENPDAIHQKDFPEENPFLHLSLHLALREQIKTNRPEGIQIVYQSLRERLGDAHLAEHHMMEVLGKILFAAQRSGHLPDEATYLDRLQGL